MTGRRSRATLYGAAAGALLGLLFLAFWVGRTALGSVDAVLLAGEGRARAQFAVSSGGMYVLTVLSGAVGGLVIAGITYALGREAEPDSPKFPLSYLLPAAALTSAVTAYAVLRAGVGAAAIIDDGVITVSVFRLGVVTAIAGAAAGAITSRAVDALARPSFLGLSGEAWPTSSREFMGEMMRAIGGPTLAVVVIATLAISLSQLLLTLDGAASVAVFGVTGAIVLGGAALAAYRPWERPEQG